MIRYILKTKSILLGGARLILLVLFVIISVLTLHLPRNYAHAQTDETTAPVFEATPVTIYLFFSQTCPHCKHEKEFLNEYLKEESDVELHEFESSRIDSVYLMQNASEIYGIQIGGVPLTFIGSWYTAGFDTNGIVAQSIRDAVTAQQNDPQIDIIGELIKAEGHTHLFSDEEKQIYIENFLQKQKEVKEGAEESGTQDKFKMQNNDNTSEESNDSQQIENKPEGTVKDLGFMPEPNPLQVITLPIIGAVAVGDFPILFITIFMGFIDGFNPCAMWTLFFLISLLLGMKSRKRMWLLGGTFILVSGIVYFAFMAAWLNVFLVIGMIPIVRFGIATFAIGAGSYTLVSAYRDKEKGCSTEDSEKKRATFEKIKDITKRQNLFIALGGISLLAIAVNTVEIMCSAGLPALYTSMLTTQGLSTFQYYAYIAIYVFFFMLDDLVIFIIAMATLKLVGVETKYGRISKIIGSITMIAIGGWLVFQ